jgi:hypothetical protein
MLIARSTLTTLFLAGLAALTPARANEMASATYDATSLGGGVFKYDIKLTDTGTTTIGTFWFSWVPGEGFMPTLPSSILSPAGWSDMVTNGPPPSDGYSIQWVTTTPIMSGDSVSGYEFQSTMTPAQLASISLIHPPQPIATSFIFSGAPFSDPGTSFVATPVPEPSTLGLTLLLLAALAFACYRRHPAIER